MFTHSDLTPGVYDIFRAIDAKKVKNMIQEPSCTPFARLYSEDPNEKYGDLLLGFFVPESEESSKVEFDVLFNKILYCHHSLAPGEFVRACDDNLVPLIAMKYNLEFRITADKPVYCVYANLPSDVQKQFTFNPKNYMEHPLSNGQYVYYVEGALKSVSNQRVKCFYPPDNFGPEYMSQLPTC